MKVLIEKECVREDALNQELLERMSEVDNAQITNESVFIIQ